MKHERNALKQELFQLRVTGAATEETSFKEQIRVYEMKLRESYEQRELLEKELKPKNQLIADLRAQLSNPTQETNVSCCSDEQEDMKKNARC